MSTFPPFSFLPLNPFSPIRGLALQLQTPDVYNSKLMVVFVGIAAISLLVLALVVISVLLALVVVGLKARAAVSKTVLEVKAKVYPVIEKTNGLVGDLSPAIRGITEKTHSLIEELSPKIAGIGDDVHGITTRARSMVEFTEGKLHDFAPAIDAVRETIVQANATARSANDRTAHQVERVDGMVTAVLDWTNQVPVRLQHVLSLPGLKLVESAKLIQKRGMSLLSATKEVLTRLSHRASKQGTGSLKNEYR